METVTQNTGEAMAIRQPQSLPTLYEGSRDLTAFDVVHQVRTVQEVMEAVMKPTIHYGNIPGCDKPSLLQPGAEKLAMVFRLAIKPEVEDLSENGEAHFRVTAEITHMPTGRYVGTGIGECSTLEEKYAWRRAVCHAEFESVQERKGPDYVRLKFGMKKKGTYKKDEPDYYTNEQVRANPADLRNTILQMAIKRAVVSGVKRATAASDVFAQNLEDLPEEYREMVAEEVVPEMQPPQRKSEAEKPISERLIEAFGGLGIVPSALVAYIGHPIEQITSEEVELLRNIYAAIKSGETTWEKVLEIKKEQSEVKAETKQPEPEPEKPVEKPEPKPEPEVKTATKVCTYFDEYGECVLAEGHAGSHEVFATEEKYVRTVNDEERRKLFGAMAKAKPKSKVAGDWEKESRGWIKDKFGFKSTAEITIDKYPEILKHFEGQAKAGSK
jgi:hypothetical protein